MKRRIGDRRVSLTSIVVAVVVAVITSVFGIDIGPFLQ
jgi:hypothetical protein